MANNLTPKEEFLLNPVTEHNITDAAIATFETNLRHGVKVEVPFEPKQDLHGYDHPWPGGGGKNLFDPSIDAFTASGTYRGQMIGDGESPFTVKIFDKGNNADITGCYLGITGNGINIDEGIVWLISHGDIQRTDYSTDSLRYISFYPNNEEVLSKILARFNIEVELGSTIPSAYEPYENICPIEGYTECEVKGFAKNLWDGEYVNGFVEDYGGVRYISNKNVVGSKNVIKVKPNTTYYYIGPKNSRITLWRTAIDLNALDTSAYINRIAPHMSDYLFTTPSDCNYLLFNAPTEYGPVPKGDISIQEASDTDYYPVQVNTVPISWKHAEGTYEFSPVQEGSGDPSPENVRPIHPGLTITRDDNTELTVYGGSITFNDDGTSRVDEILGLFTGIRFLSSSKRTGGFYSRLSFSNNYVRDTSFDSLVICNKAGTRSADYSTWNIYPGGTIGTTNNNYVHVYIPENAIDYHDGDDITTLLNAAYDATSFEVILPLGSPQSYTLSITETQRVIEALGDKVTTTIYGGTVTVNEDGSADLLEETISLTFNGTEGWGGYGVGQIRLFPDTPAQRIYGNIGNGMLCNLIRVSDNLADNPRIWFRYSGDRPAIFAMYDGITHEAGNPSVNTPNVWRQYLADLYENGTPLQLTQILLEPKTYHFPNVGKLKAFLGTNNIWADIGNVNVKYLTQNSETGMEYRGDRALELRRRAMIADAPTIHTTTGSEETGGLASFKSYVKAPVKKIEIPFKPKQDLHGYDYPWPAGGGKNLFNKDGTFVDNVVIKSETAYKLASGTGSAISMVTPGTTVLLNETIDGVTKLKPWIYLGLDESGNARLYREKVDDEPRQMDASTANISYDGCDMDQYLIDETTGFLSRFDSATLAALVATSIKYVDYFTTGDNTASVQTISRKCFLPSYSEMGYGDDPAGNEGQSYLAVLKTYYENNTDSTVKIGKTDERIVHRTWLRSGHSIPVSRHRVIDVNGARTWGNSNDKNNYVRPMISLDPNTVVETVPYGKDVSVQNTTLYTDPITVSPSTTYVLSGRCYTNQIMRVDEYDANDNCLKSTVSASMNHPSITFTTTENTAYVLVNPDWVIQFVQLEAGSAATSYAPYSNICPIEGYSDGISYFESKKANIYGARWDRLQHRLTRYGAAKDFDTDVTNFRINGEVSSSYDNPFDSCYPWSERKLCNINLTQYMALQNGSSIKDCVTHWEGEIGFSYDDPDGVWVYTPKFWGRSYDDANGHRCFEVSDRPVHDFIEYEEQITARWRGVVETRDINGESKQILLPVLGNPGRYTPVNTLHTYAKNYGGSITSIYSLDASYLLMIVEFASMNLRLDVGGGVNDLYRQNAADKFVENATDSTIVKLHNTYAAGMIPDALLDIGTASGGNQIGSRWIVSAELDESTDIWTVTLNEPITVTTANFWTVHGMVNRPDAAIGSKSGYLGENNRSHAYYRGEELWGNFWMYVIGVYKSTRDEVWLCPKTLDPDDYNTLNESVYVNTGIQLATSSGLNREFGYPEKSHELSAPAFNVLVGGNITNPIGSYYYTAVREARNLMVGGSANFSTSVGFFWHWHDTSSASSWPYSASPRLKNPPKGA